MVAGEVGGGAAEVVRLAVCPLAHLGVYAGLQFIPVLHRVAGRVEEPRQSRPALGLTGDRVLAGQEGTDRHLDLDVTRAADAVVGAEAGDYQVRAVDAAVAVLLGSGHGAGLVERPAADV